MKPIIWWLALAGVTSAVVHHSAAATRAATPRAFVARVSKPVVFPAETDSNSPAFWNEEGNLVLFNSSGFPTFSVGPSLGEMTVVGPANLENAQAGRNWLESVVRASDGTLYGYFHNEPAGICPDRPNLTAPRIGAMRSTDDGQTWEDLGLILTAEEGFERCDTANSYFAGGVGDFSATLDREQQYVYFFFSVYAAGEGGGQGVAVARMAWADRDRPSGRVFKYYDGTWSEAGLGGVDTAIYPASVGWEEEAAASFWGPSVHWNSSLRQYVMLLSYNVGSAFENLGVFIAYAPTLDAPTAWTEPEQILEGGGWYPQVIGIELGSGTDSLAGSEAWLCVHGVCAYQIHFDASDSVPTSTRAGVVMNGPRSRAPLVAGPPVEASRRRSIGGKSRLRE